MKQKYFPIYAGIAIGLLILGSCVFWGLSIHRLGEVLSK